MAGAEASREEKFKGQGSYRHLYWDLALVGDTVTPAYELASLHELFHADLDVTTDFGSLLCAYAYLRRAFGESSAAAATHASLGLNSRRTHETFATFASLLAIADPGFDAWAAFPLEDYKAYVRIGESLCRGLKGRFFRFHAAIASLRICMQAPVTAIALSSGLFSFRFRDLAPWMLPDYRLWTIQRIAGEPEFWTKAVEQIRRDHDHSGWKDAFESEADDRAFVELLGSQDDGLSSLLLRGIHEMWVRRLGSLGIGSVPYDGHVANASAIVSACEELVGSRQIDGYGLKRSSELELSAGAAGNFELERVVLRKPRRAALLDIPIEQYIREAAESMAAPESIHFIAVRWPERMAEQYEFDEEDRRAILSHGSEPLCFVEAVVADEEGEVVLVTPVQRPEDVGALAKSARCFSSVSSAALRKPGWEKWIEALAENTSWTVLWDTSPFDTIAHWAKSGIDRIRHGRVNITDDEARYTLFWAWPGSDEEGIRFVAPCSLVLATTLAVHLERIGKRTGMAVEELELEGDDLRSIQPLLFHLFGVEASFDFAARSE